MVNCIFKDGDLVEISSDLSKTERYFGVDKEMELMKGKKYKIRRVISKDEVTVGRFLWHPADLIPTTEEKEVKIEIAIFDSNNLVL